MEYVLKKRLPEHIHSDITLGKMNCYLDEMANLRAYADKNNGRGTRHHNHDWRKVMQKVSDVDDRSKNHEEKQSDAMLRANWFSRIMSNGLSPLEHKWLVRILQKKVRKLSAKTSNDQYNLRL